MAKKFPLHPKHPERLCWGCEKYCPAQALICGNGSGRTEHPAETLGEDWYQWGPDAAATKADRQRCRWCGSDPLYVAYHDQE